MGCATDSWRACACTCSKVWADDLSGGNRLQTVRDGAASAAGEAYPWAHLDIAGMALIEKRHETPYVQAGGTGFGVRLLVDLLRNW